MKDLEKIITTILEALCADQKNPLYMPSAAVSIATEVDWQKAAMNSDQKVDEKIKPSCPLEMLCKTSPGRFHRAIA